MAGKPPSASTVNIKSHERSYSIMFSKKKTECRVCGYRFTPERENIYTAEEPRSMADMLTKAPTRFSAVDCPVCGCQIRLADRAPRIDLPAITEQHDADAEETEGGDRQDGEMLFVLHTGNGRAFTKLGSRRRGILQSALRTRDRQVGSKGFQGSAGGVSDCFAYPSADGYGIFSRLHLRESGNPLRARAATVHGRRRERRRSSALPFNGSYL